MNAADDGAAVPRRPSPIVPVLVTATWVFQLGLATANPDPFNPVSFVDYLAVLTFSAALAAFAPAAWLIARLATARTRWLFLASSVTAGGALVAAIGNIVEDGFGISEAGGLIFVSGLGGLLLGLIALTIVLAARRELQLAGLTVASLVGLFSSANGGGTIVAVAWLGVSIWSFRGPRG